MTTSSLSEKGRSALNTRQSEPESSVRANSGEAQRLYQRGVAAARGGQKRIAAGFLTRSVQLDPRNEGAWLWLSGVLEDPRQVAFCLKSVLNINPNNERAKRGLAWLEQRHTVNTGGMTTASLSAIETPVAPPVPARKPDPDTPAGSDSWWVGWRQWRRESRTFRLLLWSLPILILGLALAIHQLYYQSYTTAMQEGEELTRQATEAVAVPTAEIATTLQPAMSEAEQEALAVVPVLEAEPASVRESKTIAYMDALSSLRTDLRGAVDTYREVTGRPGNTVNHVAATQTLYNEVEQAYQRMQGMNPPADLISAHNEYMSGLQEELAALNDMLEFYGSYQIDLANRAVLRFQTANEHFDRARTMFDARLQQLATESNVSVHTIR